MFISDVLIYLQMNIENVFSNILFFLYYTHEFTYILQVMSNASGLRTKTAHQCGQYIGYNVYVIKSI